MGDATYQRLKGELARIVDLNRALGLAGWDQQTKMPPRGANSRAEVIATLAGVIHERSTSPEIGQHLDELRSFEAEHDYASIEASLVRVTRREYDKLKRVPAELQEELARASGLAFPAWVEARKSSNFDAFAPHLERMLELKLQYIRCFDEFDTAYDALLDDFEPGMTTVEVAAVFARLREALTPLVARVRERQDRVDASPLLGDFPKERQRALLFELLPHMDYQPDTMRLDEAPHPFASSMAITDVRLTTRFDERNLAPALFGTIHELGHGLYEAGFSLELDRTPLARAASLGLHESQSRFWENIVGRGRPFWTFASPLLRSHFPEQFGDVTEDALYRAANRMMPSLIRVEADEATYVLHIILRFELEQDLVNGKLKVNDLPAAWNAKMREYLGVEVPDDAHGVLQDIHWADGYLGYFPTYALGSVISAQIWERVKADNPNIEQSFANGEFLELREWLREHLHKFGRKFTAKEAVEIVAGRPLDPEPFIAYITEKIDELYGR
jgi:carboxypeptidase Taq